MSNYIPVKKKLVNGVVYYFDINSMIVKYYNKNGELKTKPIKFHFSMGNRKVKAMNTGFLPTDERLTLSNGDVLTNIGGSCVGCCSNCKSSCYAKKATLYHHNANIVAYGSNQILFMYDTEKYFEERTKAIEKYTPKVFRIQESGEYFSKKLMEMDMLDMANNHPDIMFYGYTERHDWLNEIINDKFNGIAPKNIHINHSVWKNNYKVKEGDAAFIVDDGSQPELDKITHCPAVSIDGKMVDGVHCNAPCKRCIAHNNITACYIHGGGKHWVRTKDIVINYLTNNPTERILDTDGKTWVTIDDLKKEV